MRSLPIYYNAFIKLATFLSIVAFVPLVLTPSAHAVKLCKWVGDDGDVTYQDRAPASGAAKIEEKSIEPNQNTADRYVPPPSRTPGSPAPTTGSAAEDKQPPARLGADGQKRRRVRQGGGIEDGGGVPAP